MSAECHRMKSKPSFLLRIQLYLLYRCSFPSSERKPFSVILNMWKKGKTDIWLLMDCKRLVGFATTINSDTLILLDYLAVDKKMRGRGCGSEILHTVRQHNPKKGVFLEIESTYEKTPEQEKRIQRKQFYLNNGMMELGVLASVFGVQMELLGYNCELNFDQYRAFYRDNYGAFAADHIHPLIFPEK